MNFIRSRLAISIVVSVAAMVFSATSGVVAQSVLLVPSSTFPTVQAAIQAAAPGDLVQVAPGVYTENIDFLGKSVVVKGAGPGLSILDGGSTGSVVKFREPTSSSARLEGFSLINGTGTTFVSVAGAFTVGWGIYMSNDSQLQGVVAPTIRNCHFVGHAAPERTAIFMIWSANPTIEDCEFSNNLGASVFGATETLAVIRRCRFLNNVSEGLAGVSIGGGSSTNPGAIIEDCLFQGNTSIGLQNPNYPQYLHGQGAAIRHSGFNLTVRRSAFLDNYAYQGAVGASFSNGTVRFDSCLFSNNVSSFGGVWYKAATSGAFEFVNCTFSGNQATTEGSVVWSNTSYMTTIRNCILQGNGGGAPSAIFTTASPTNVFVDHCNIQGGWSGPGSGNFDLPPMFEDSSNGDFHIRPDSPCVNTGTSASGVSTTDFEGDPRPLYGLPDIGADECGDVALDSSMAGTILDPMGQAMNVLTVNGSAGGVLRRVVIAVGAPISFQMASPNVGSAPAPFIIFGMLATPDWQSPLDLPFSLGRMAFAPCPMSPGQEPFLFTLANNGAALPCSPVLPSNPAPWSSGIVGALPYPISFALQGMVLTTSGTIGITNGVVVHVQ